MATKKPAMPLASISRPLARSKSSPFFQPSNLLTALFDLMQISERLKPWGTNSRSTSTEKL